MLREFTKSVGRFSKGERRDYPSGTWTGVANSVGERLDSFSRPIEDGPQSSNLERAKAARKGVQ